MNYTNSSSPSPSAIIDETVCLYDMYPCSLTWTGNLFLLLIYGGILAWGAKQINLGSDKLLEVFPPGLIGGVLLPVLGALPDATVIFFSVINASGADAQEQLNELLVKMSFEIGNDTPQFKGERTFRCLLLANPEPGSSDTILRKDDAWEQLAKTGYDIDKNRKEIIPLGGIDIGMVDLRLEIQEKSRR